MGAGNKKNKRHSVSPNTEQQLIERTAENDYGVLSDPDETAITTSTVTAMEAATATATAVEAEAAMEAATATATAVEAEAAMEANRLNDDIHTEQLTLSDSQQSLPPSSPLSSQEQPPSKQSSSPLLQSQIPESQLSPSNKKSLIALQLKLTRDKNFSRKITLHTFFSYIILALEMERASSASIARISPNNVQHLIEYMIEHHSETEAVRIYLQTLIDTGVVKNLIESVIEFNKDQTEAFNKLLTSEQLELEISSIQEDKRTAKSVEVAADNEQGPAPAPQTSQDSMATRIRNFFKRCVCCCQPRRRRQQERQERRNNDEELKTQTPAVEEQNKPDTSENERTGENERVKCEQP